MWEHYVALIGKGTRGPLRIGSTLVGKNLGRRKRGTPEKARVGHYYSGGPWVDLLKEHLRLLETWTYQRIRTFVLKTLRRCIDLAGGY